MSQTEENLSPRFRAHLGVIQSNAGNSLYARLVIDCSVLVEQSTMPVVGVFAQTDVAGDGHLGKLLADEFGGQDDGRDVCVGMGTAIVLRQVVCQGAPRKSG
jgi:hypothetical protein